MKKETEEIFEELFIRYPSLSGQRENIEKAYVLLLESVLNDGTVFICGNGGSASDSEHIVGELMKRFKKPRPADKTVKEKLYAYGEDGKNVADTLEGAMRAVSLTSHIALTTAFSNDRNPAVAFAQQLYGLGRAGDMLVAISTSGNSLNCVYALMVAKAKGLKTVSLTGTKDSKMSSLSDVTVKVPETETFKVQELHLPVYHALCAMLESELF